MNREWLEGHFDTQYLKLVEKLGWKKADDPRKSGWWNPCQQREDGCQCQLALTQIKMQSKVKSCAKLFPLCIVRGKNILVCPVWLPPPLLTCNAKRKNTKVDFSGEYFKSSLEVQKQEQVFHNQRNQLEQGLKTTGCALHGDLAEEWTRNENKDQQKIRIRTIWKKLEEQIQFQQALLT